MKLLDAIKAIEGDPSHIDPALLERTVADFVIDSREVKAGDVFFALSQPDYERNGFNGDFDDATLFAAGALELGALAAVIRSDRFEEHYKDLEKYSNKIILVDDAIAALQRLARSVYSDWGKPVVAITGSAGKTTAKELTAHVLEASGKKILRNIKNYNNGLGHPLTVLTLAKDPTYDAAVLEMGMSTPMNEIARLCRITPPDVSVVLNVLAVHVEHLGSIENVAKAKAEIVEGMKPGGVAVLNADDPRVAAMAELSKGTVVTFGIELPADISAREISFKGFGLTRFELAIDGKTAAVELPLNGRHNILNALAAAAVGHVFGMEIDAIAASLNSVAAPPQRGEILRFADGFTVINDSYNSNPDALLAMTRTLVDGAGKDARKIVVAGEMLELGPDAAALHEKTGEEIAALGIDMLIGVRGLAEQLVLAASQNGVSEACFAEDSDEAGKILCEIIQPGDVVLIKGSRGVKTERVIDALREKFGKEESGPSERHARV